MNTVRNKVNVLEVWDGSYWHNGLNVRVRCNFFLNKLAIPPFQTPRISHLKTEIPHMGQERADHEECKSPCVNSSGVSSDSAVGI
jgi:hypothetical protein